jgi:hypothetical protein
MLQNSKTDYLSRAKEIINLHSLEPYIQSLLDLWVDSEPPSLGHGFGHVLEVAVECYELAQINSYEYPQELFIAGLFHDVYRPAEGKDGREDHHQKSCELSLQILESLDAKPEYIERFKFALSDDWKKMEELDDFSSLLFLGDKSRLNREMADAYAWASNNYCLNNGKEIVYKSALHTMNGFVNYFHKIIPILLKIKLDGTGKIIDNFVEIVISLKDQHKMDPKGSNFQEYLEKKAREFSKKEKKYLKEFIKSDTKLKSLLNGPFDHV